MIMYSPELNEIIVIGVREYRFLNHDCLVRGSMSSHTEFSIIGNTYKEETAFFNQDNSWIYIGDV